MKFKVDMSWLELHVMAAALFSNVAFFVLQQPSLGGREWNKAKDVRQ